MTPEPLNADPAHAVRTARPPRLGPLLAGTAMLALALGAGVARGQTAIGNGAAFQGSATGALGTVTLASSGTTDTLTVHSTTAIVDWTPYDTAGGTAPIGFLPQGSTGVFQNGSEVSGFTVLNRINPATTGRPIEFDGNVVSQLVGATGAVSRGGNVWFYAPGGIIVGATGTFNVGSLILTANAINTGGDTALPSPTGGISFTGAGGSTSAVTINAGAQIAQPVPGSYLAVVAPRITQAGTVTVNGSVGYLAAEAATVTINAGLFNITNVTGSTVAAGGETTLTHTGTTTGPAQTSTGPAQAIYLVAVSRNDAVTMLAGGTIGYQAASTATVSNGAVILGADATPDGASPTGLANLSTGSTANIALTGGSFTSAVTAEASGRLALNATTQDLALTSLTSVAAGGTTIGVAAGHTLSASGSVGIGTYIDPDPPHSSFGEGFSDSITVASGGTLAIGGNLTVQVGDRLVSGTSALQRIAVGTIDMQVAGTATIGGALTLSGTEGLQGAAVAGLQGGTTSLSVSGGTLTAGATSLSSDVHALSTSAHPADSTGGTAQLLVTGSGSSAQLASLNVDAGTDQTGYVTTTPGGTQTGGAALVQASGGGRITVSGTANVIANSIGSSASGTPDTVVGGSASLIADGGTISLTNASSTATIAADATSGNPTGGAASVIARNGGTLALAGALQVDSNAVGGAGATAASRGGTTTLLVDNGTLSVSGATLARAYAQAYATSTSAAGLNAVGGTTTLTVSGGGQASMAGLVTLDTTAFGYLGSDTPSGNGTGGTTSVSVTGGTSSASLGGLQLNARSVANPYGTDASIVSQGGTAQVTVAGGSLTLTTGNAALAADASGGHATGGIAALAVTGGGRFAMAGNLTLDGSGANEFRADLTGHGGTATITADNGAISIGGTASVSANGITVVPPFSASDAANAAIGGTASLAAGNGGSVTVSGTTMISAAATAAFSTSAAGGSATGGTALVAANAGGTLTFGTSLTVDASATGNPYGTDPALSSHGGAASLAANGGTVAIMPGGDTSSDPLTIRAPASGGTATGGSAALIADDGGAIHADVADPTMQNAYATIDASATSGNYYYGYTQDETIPGYDATGGTATVRAGNGTIALNAVQVSANADAGAGYNTSGALGSAFGGTARITTTSASGSIAVSGYAEVDADAFAGYYYYYNGSPTVSSGSGGQAIGGTAEVVARGGTISFGAAASLYVDAYGETESGTASGSDDPDGPGVARGGAANLLADDNGAITLGGYTTVDSSGYNDGYYGEGYVGAGVPSTVFGGAATVATGTLDGQPGTITFAQLYVSSAANGGYGVQGGLARGGSATVEARTGSISGSFLSVTSLAQGGAAIGYDPVTGAAVSGVGGDAIGGTAALIGSGGAITIADVNGPGTASVASFVYGGGGAAAAPGGTASGGTASVAVSAGSVSGGVLSVIASNIGGIGGAGTVSGNGGGIGGTGGDATGGSAVVAVSGGAVTLAALGVQSTVAGGYGGTGDSTSMDVDDNGTTTTITTGLAGGLGGNGSGGVATLTNSGGAIALGLLTVGAVGAGGIGGVGGDGDGYAATTGAGQGGTGGPGGFGTGGVATIASTGGTTSATTTLLSATALVGPGGSGGTSGEDPDGNTTQAASGADGNGKGGTAIVQTGGAGSLALGDLTIAVGRFSGDLSTIYTNYSDIYGDDDEDEDSSPLPPVPTDGTVEAGLGRIVTLDAGNAPATPITLTSLAMTDVADVTTTGDMLQISAAAPIAVSGDADVSGFTLSRYDMAGRGTLSVGGAFTNETLEVAGTQTAPTAGTIAIVAGSADVLASFAGLTLPTLATTRGDLSLSAAQGIATTGLISAGRATLMAGSDTSFGTLTAQGRIDIAAGGALSGTTLASTADRIDATAALASTIGSVTAGGGIDIDAGGGAHYGTVTAGTAAGGTTDTDPDFGSVALIAKGGDLVVDTGIIAYRSIGLVAGGALSVPALVAGPGGSIGGLAGGAIALGAVTAPGLLYVGGPAALSTLGSDPSAAQIVGVLGAAGPVATGGAVMVGPVTTGSATVAAGTTLTLAGPLVATAGAATLTAGGSLATGNLSATGAVSATSSGGAVSVGQVTAGQPTIAGDIRLTAMQAVTAGTLSGSGSIGVSSAAAGLQLGDLTSSGGSIATMAGGGDIAMGAVRAAGSITIAGPARITAGDLTAGAGTLLPGESSGGGTDPATGGIATGFDQAAVARCDDCATDAIGLPFTLNYFGRTYTATYVSNNGYLTFNSSQSSYTPTGLGTDYSGQPIIAAFFADVDTRNGLSAQATYGTGTFAGRQAFAATWNGVGYYSSAADKLDNFQIILTNRADTGAGNFDIYYNYTNIGWETGSMSGGVNGFGGTSAAVGYNAGISGNPTGTFFELPGSRMPGSFINGGTAPLIATTNDGIAGQLLFQVRNGQVGTAAGAPPGIHVSNLSGTGTADVTLGNLSGEATEVHATGRVTVGNVSVGDRGSGIAATGQPFATVLDAGLGLQAGNVTSTGLIVLGSRAGDVSAGTVAGGASVMALADGSVTLGPVTTGTGAADTLYIGGPATDALTGFGLTTLLSGTAFSPATLASATPMRAGGTIAVMGPITTGTLRAAAAGPITLTGVTASGALSLDSGAGITSGALSAGGAIGVSGHSGLALGSVASTSGAITLASDAGGIASGALSAGGGLTASGSGAVTLGAVTAASVSATSTGGTLTLGATNAAGTVALAAAGLLDLAAIDGSAITLNSADIAIAPGAAIGSARTTTLDFVNNGGGRTVIGDNAGAATGDYALSAAELSGAHANAISIDPTHDIAIGDLTIAGPAAANPNLTGSRASFLVTGAGAIRLTGALRFTGMATGDTVTLRSTGGGAITGVLPQASIVLDNGSGALAGTLALDAGTILFATSGTAGAVQAATTPAATDAALGDPGTLANPAGYLRADTVSLRFANALYTQNSGASSALADRAGVTAGSGGIVLLPTTPTAAQPSNLVLNARLERGDTTLTGDQVFSALALQPTGFASGATLNSCLLDSSNCGQPTTTVTPAMIVTKIVQSIQPVQDVVTQVQLASPLGNAAAYSFSSPAIITTIDLSVPTLPPLIDEPVTGAGNDAMWVNIGIGRELAPMGGKPADAPKP